MSPAQLITWPGAFSGYRAVAPMVAVPTLAQGTVTLAAGEAISAEVVPSADLARLVEGGYLEPIGA